MCAVVAGRDVLAVLPTGAGKSAIYQVPALLIDGPTVVVSPLLALQRDQMENIEESAAPDAVAVNSAERASERREAWEAVREGEAEYLFLSPEQLAKDEVVDRLAELGVGLFVVDEAHCVSAWGHDFRPDYLRLGPVIERLKHPPVVALTATAAKPVRDDTVMRLGLRDSHVVIASFDRPICIWRWRPRPRITGNGRTSWCACARSPPTRRLLAACSTPPAARTPTTTPANCGRPASGRPPTTPACAPRTAARCTRTSSRTASTSSSPP